MLKISEVKRLKWACECLYKCRAKSGISQFKRWYKKCQCKFFNTIISSIFSFYVQYLTCLGVPGNWTQWGAWNPACNGSATVIPPERKRNCSAQFRGPCYPEPYLDTQYQQLPCHGNLSICLFASPEFLTKMSLTDVD